MHHFIFSCSIFLTIVAVTCSKSIGLENDEDTESTSRIAAVAPQLSLIHEKPEAVSKIDARRSLAILGPSVEEEDESEAKRSKPSIRRERLSVPLSKEKSRTIVKQGNAKNIRTNKRRAEDTVVALKKPSVGEKPMTLAEAREKAKKDTFRDQDLLDSIRKGLKLNGPTVGAPRDVSSPNIRVVDEDDFVCYCKKKTKEDTNDSVVSKPQYSTNKNNAGRKVGASNKSSKKPAQKAVSNQSPASNQFPAQYPNYYPNAMYPGLQNAGQGRLPYIPYTYNADPRFPMLSSGFPGQIPPNMNVPINPAGNAPDSIVGQRAPTARKQNCKKNQQAVTKPSCSPNMLGKSLTQSTEKTIPPTTILEEASPSLDLENAGTPDYNLQSESMDPSEPSKAIESPAKAPNVGAANPESTDKSPRGSENDDVNKFETTADGSGTLDYSDIKEVTSAYFTSKAYDTEITRGPGSFDDSYITSSGPMYAYPEDSGSNDADLQGRLNVPTENSVAAAKSGGDVEKLDNVDPDNQSPVQSSGEANEGDKDDLVGESNPRSNTEGSVDDESKGDAITEDVANTGENEDVYGLTEPPPAAETTELIPTELTPQAPDEPDVSAEINDKNTPRSSKELSAEHYATESPETEDNAGPLGNDYAGENFESDKPEEKIDVEKEEGEERSPVSDSPTGGTIYSVDAGNDYTTIGEDFINRDNEGVGAVLETTIGNENEDATPSVESTLKSSGMDDTVGKKGTPDPSLPFCDNTLLQKSIKAVINNFATGDSPEMNGETVGSPMAEDLLPEIVKVPNLKGILSMPAIEHTVLDRVKDLLSTMTGVPRKNLDTDWATNVIRNNLQHTMSAAPREESELPPMTVQERQFKDGKWVTNLATLEPGFNGEENPSTDLEKVQASVKSLLRDPAINLQAAKNPAVQNMIVQSVRNSLKTENAAGGEQFEDVIQSALDNELSIMNRENAEATTMNDEYETTTFDTSDIDMNKLLDIARSEAGLDEKKENEIRSTTENIISSNTQPVDTGLVGAARDTKLSDASETPQKVDIQNSEPVTLNVEGLPEEPKYDSSPTETRTNTVGAPLKDEDESSTVTYTDGAPPKMESIESGDPVDKDKDKGKSTKELVGMANTPSNQEPRAEDDSAADDFTYLGKISMKSKGDAEGVQSLKNSELFYVGDGVKLPLEIRKLEDGAYALSISRKVCEHLLDKECPCCVPVKGNVVRTVKRNSGKRNADKTIQTGKRKRISKRESTKSILPNEPGKCDSADDSVHILSLPVETFARRYNLSLNLGKLQTPRNFGVEEEIDGRSRDRLKNARNRLVNNDDTDLSRELSVQQIPESGKEGTAIAKKTWTNNNTYKDDDATSYEYQIEKQRNLEKFRYQRNIDRNTNKRAEIVKNVLNWLRDMILNTRAKR